MLYVKIKKTTSADQLVVGYNRDIRRHQDPAEQGVCHAYTAQHEHVHRVEAGGRLQEDIPRKHRVDISGTTQGDYDGDFFHRGRSGTSSDKPSRRR